jgi:hypothetical protein
MEMKDVITFPLVFVVFTLNVIMLGWIAYRSKKAAKSRIEIQ